jgi:ATP-dependent protease ClpP protease subunit
MKRGILAILLLAGASPGCAAEITAGGSAITMSGLIGPDDAEAFKTKAQSFQGKATVILNGPGGNLLAALAIGEFVRLRGWSTYVSGECDSACALIWLGGSPRIMTPDAKVGFHGASVNGQGTGVGNAALGAYLNRIGLSYEAVRYATKAGPDDITYLTPDEAKRVGIEVRVTSAEADGPGRPAFGQLAVAPRPTARITDPNAARLQAEGEASFLVRYLFSNTSNNARTLASAYWDNAVYNGQMISVVDILADKQRFFETWPSRSYTIRSMTPAHCTGDGGVITECRVSGIVDWEASNTARKLVGSATFEYVLTPWPLGSWSISEGGQAGLRIAAESRKVFSSQVVELADQGAHRAK